MLDSPEPLDVVDMDSFAVGGTKSVRFPDSTSWGFRFVLRRFFFTIRTIAAEKSSKCAPNALLFPLAVMLCRLSVCFAFLQLQRDGVESGWGDHEQLQRRQEANSSPSAPVYW